MWNGGKIYLDGFNDTFWQESTHADLLFHVLDVRLLVQRILLHVFEESTKNTI